MRILPLTHTNTRALSQLACFSPNFAGMEADLRLVMMLVSSTSCCFFFFGSFYCLFCAASWRLIKVMCTHLWSTQRRRQRRWLRLMREKKQLATSLASLLSLSVSSSSSCGATWKRFPEFLKFISNWFKIAFNCATISGNFNSFSSEKIYPDLPAYMQSTL